MPGAVLPNEGLPALLKYMLQSTISGVLPWELMLFTNDYTPDQGTTLADLTEATFSGYSRETLTRSIWTSPTVIDDHAVSTYGTTPIQWISSGGPTETPYGVGYVDVAAGVLRFVQRFEPADIRAVAPGGVLTFLPRLTLTTEV